MKKIRFVLLTFFFVSLICSCDYNTFDDTEYEEIIEDSYESSLTEEDEGEDDKPSGNPTGG
mgnify:CR=1 FL=1